MASAYQSFLRAPKAQHLAPNASLHYVTTTTTILKPDAILAHLDALSRQVEKKEERTLNTTEASNGACLETETHLTFLKGGGVYLPGMDENMLADVTVIVPIVHVVTYDDNGAIAQIRQYWDQGTMLKQVEAIGKTGKNWPIRDGKAQVRLVQDSIKTAGQAAPAPNSRGSDSHRSVSDSRPGDDFTKRLFAPGEEPTRSRVTSAVVPRESAKPAERDWAELFPNGQDATAGGKDIGSPNVRSPYQPVLKAGAGKNYRENRLFDDTDPSERTRSPERKKVDPRKYDHFDFGNGEDAPIKAPALGVKKGNQSSNWNFEDFATPAKLPQKGNREQERHFGYGIDGDDATPIKRDVVHLPRPDAKANFDMTDEPSPAAGPKQRNPLDATTNINATRRQGDYDPQINQKQSTPLASENIEPPKSNTNAAFKPRSDMSSNWSLGDMTAPVSDKAPKIYKTAGDGMGGKAGSRLWDIAGDDAPETYGGAGGEKQVYKTYGNGMGGRKGTGLGWSIGDPDAE